MFGLHRKKTVFKVVAPIEGVCEPLTAVDDDVFAKKMMGDGFAIKPAANANIIVAPIDAQVITIPASKHAIGLKSTLTDIEILIHIGLNTVQLAGEGFEALVKPDDHVAAGQPLVKFDTKLMQQKQLDMSTMVIFTAGYQQAIDLGSKYQQNVQAGQALLTAE